MAKETQTSKKNTKTPASKRKTPVSKKKTSAVKKKSAPRAKRSKPWGHVQCTLFLLGVSLLLTVFIGMTLYLFILLDIPNLKSIKDYQPKTATLVLDRDHKIFKRKYEENRRLVTLAMMPGLLPKAFIAAEDARFYQHPGVDIWSIFRAFFHNIRAGAKAHGGSTITQQVTRSLLLSRKKVYSRKIKEAILAYRIDSVMSKDDIIYIYLNQIYLGEGAHGVEAAATTYFDRGVKDLTLGQMALLAGLPQAPSRYTPFKNLELAKKRQAYVLNRMAEDGYITPEDARRAYEEPLSLDRKNDDGLGGEYYAQYVTNYITDKYGPELLTNGGLTIYTNMDRTMQLTANASIQKGLAALSGENKNGKTPQAAMLVMEPESGKVRALVGGADFNVSQFDRAIQARRQPGSAFKPIVYAAAMEKGFTPESILIDEPLSLAGTRRGKDWQPRNFDNRYYGPTSLRTGLIHSRNIVAIKLLQEVGIDSVVRMARDLGIHSKIKPDLTLALGSSEVSLLEMTGAYTPFATNGSYISPILIERIIDRHGNILEENKPRKVRAMSEWTATRMNRMLQDVIAQGTGKSAQGLNVAAGGKTGTTDSYMDAWFIGYTRDLVAGVWVGHDKKTSLGKGASGGRVAAPIWLDFMKQVESKSN
jgi:penicillin-binding protein 1A